MPTYTANLQDADQPHIDIKADSLDEAKRIAREMNLPVESWQRPAATTQGEPAAPPPASPSPPPTDIARLIEQNERLYALLKDIKKDGIGLSKRTHKRLRSAMGWQVFFALLIYGFLAFCLRFVAEYSASGSASSLN